MSLKKPAKVKESTDGHCSDTSSSTSDSNTYYEDDFSSSDDSSADDGTQFTLNGCDHVWCIPIA